jgi:hypothetical protein
LTLILANGRSEVTRVEIADAFSSIAPSLLPRHALLSDFRHACFSLRHESRLDEEPLSKEAVVEPGRLLKILQKGLVYMAVEAHVNPVSCCSQSCEEGRIRMWMQTFPIVESNCGLQETCMLTHNIPFLVYPPLAGRIREGMFGSFPPSRSSSRL